MFGQIGLLGVSARLLVAVEVTEVERGSALASPDARSLSHLSYPSSVFFRTGFRDSQFPFRIFKKGNMKIFISILAVDFFILTESFHEYV